MEKLMKEIRESCGMMYEVEDDNVEDQANEKIKSDDDTISDETADDSSGDDASLTQKDIEVPISEKFQKAMSEYVSEFEQHFSEYFDMNETVWVNKGNGSMVVFPVDRNNRFEIIFVFNLDKKQEDMVKMISCIYRNKRRRVLEKRDFNIEDINSNISTPEAIFPTRKVEKFLGKDLVKKENSGV